MPSGSSTRRASLFSSEPANRSPHMTHLRPSTSNSERGASMVEFALILPVLLLFLFGVLQFGLLFFRYQGIQAAAREGARVASISTYDNDEISDRVEATLDDIPFNGSPTVTISP